MGLSTLKGCEIFKITYYFLIKIFRNKYTNKKRLYNFYLRVVDNKKSIQTNACIDFFYLFFFLKSVSPTPLKANMIISKPIPGSYVFGAI